MEGEIIDSKLTWHLCNFAIKINKFTTHFYGEREEDMGFMVIT